MIWITVIFVIVIIVVISAAGSDTATSTGGSLPQGGMAVRHEFTFLTIQGIEFEVIQFEVAGVSYEWTEVGAHSLRLRLFDTTRGERVPIWCAVEGLTSPGNRDFELVSKMPTLSYGQGFYLRNFARLGTVPVEALIFPHRGARKIGIEVEHLCEGLPVEKVKREFSFEVTSEGYIEGQENRERAEEMGIYLGMHLAAADGSLDEVEAQVVRRWIDSQLRLLPVNRKVTRTERLKVVFEDARSKAINEGLDVGAIFSVLEEHASLAIKIEVLELCLDVMKADGIADPRELEQLDRIAQAIGISPGKYRALLDQRLAEVEVISSESIQDGDRILGIDPTWSHEKVRKHLTVEYRKWNGRVNSSDESIRKRAQEMVSLIAEARKRYL